MILQYLRKGVRVLHGLDNDMLALHKPCGLLSHPNVNNHDDSSPSLFTSSASYNHQDEAYVIHANPPHRVYLLHRLDQQTSGVILLTTNAAVAKSAKQLFKQRLVKKTYYAWCFGAVKLDSSSSHRALDKKSKNNNEDKRRSREVLWEDDYLKIKSNNFVRARVGVSSSITAKTLVSRESNLFNSSISLLKLQPLTGLSHQLRIQCSSRGYPIIGDEVYGDFKANREWFKLDSANRRLFLHANNINFTYSLNGINYSVDVSDPLPPEFHIDSFK